MAFGLKCGERRSRVLFPEGAFLFELPSTRAEVASGMSFGLSQLQVYRAGADGIQTKGRQLCGRRVVMVAVGFLAVIVVLLALVGVFALMSKDQNRKRQSGSE